MSKNASLPDISLPDQNYRIKIAIRYIAQQGWLFDRSMGGLIACFRVHEIGDYHYQSNKRIVNLAQT